MATNAERIDQLLHSHGYHYDSEGAQFMLDDRAVDGSETIDLVPDLMLDDLTAWQERRHDERRSQ